MWESDVRDYEVDFQGIVNNAVYFNYLDHARYVLFLQKGINLKEFSAAGRHLVLTECTIRYKASLTLGDIFTVETILEKMSPVKYKCHQTISRKQDGKACIISESYLCMVKDGKPIRDESLLMVISSPQ